MKRTLIILLVFLLVAVNGLYSQTEFPAGDYWVMAGGIGTGNIGVDGPSFQIVVDPKLWLSPSLMVGSRAGAAFSLETDSSHSRLGDIFTLEGQVYLRWNFLRLGNNPSKTINVFAQGGLGLLSSYRGENNPFDDVTETRGSFLADAALGATIPVTSRWHIEPSLRAGFPHQWGFTLTAGFKFPLPQKTIIQEGQDRIVYQDRVEYVEVLRTNEILRQIVITQVEYILFGPDYYQFNQGVDADGRGLNELVINYMSGFLIENPDLRVRIEGHANPVTNTPEEIQVLSALSENRANEVARVFREKGVAEEQIVVVSFGGNRTITREHDHWNVNRRVELIVIQG
ncbi:MAG: OmpA family protein, partial [Treponema sp.]|nr:OmpA family protein [Treponema sp.]